MKSYYGGPIGTYQRSFERYHPRPPTASLSPRLVCQNCNRYYLRNSNLAGMFTEPSEQKPMKNLGEKGAWAHLGTVQIFGVPRIIPGTGKSTNFKCCTLIHGTDRNTRPLKMSAKFAVGVLRDSRNFPGTHM